MPHIPVWKTRQSFVMVLCWVSLIIITMILLINYTELCPNTKIYSNMFPKKLPNMVQSLHLIQVY